MKWNRFSWRMIGIVPSVLLPSAIYIGTQFSTFAGELPSLSQSIPSTAPSPVPPTIPSAIPSPIPSVTPSPIPSSVPSSIPSAIPSTASTVSSGKPSIAGELLASERGLNYATLQDLLRTGRWLEANNLTSRLVLQLANQQQRGYLIALDTRKLPCTDLRTIDRLWLYYSDYQFGFSSQAKLWQQLGGQTYPDSRWFEAMVGWSLSSPIANPDPSSAPPGYFPFRPAYSTGIRDAFGGGWIREMPLRLKSCGIQ